MKEREAILWAAALAVGLIATVLLLVQWQNASNAADRAFDLCGRDLSGDGLDDGYSRSCMERLGYDPDGPPSGDPSFYLACLAGAGAAFSGYRLRLLKTSRIND